MGLDLEVWLCLVSVCLIEVVPPFGCLDALTRGRSTSRTTPRLHRHLYGSLAGQSSSPPKVLTANYKARPDPLCRGAGRLARDSQTLHDALATSKTAQMIIFCISVPAG